jgi:Cap4 SAVED domain
VTAYTNVPERLLTCLHDSSMDHKGQALYCAGFELQEWRCDAMADHIMEWLADYALVEEELNVRHTNMYVRLREAATRIYTSDKYKRRGELGEIVLHAICRDFFKTIPLAPRVFYLTASNDVVKSFDMAHVRYLDGGTFELWLGEAKFFQDAGEAITSAIESVNAHIDAGFLKNEKLLLGPQISKSIPHYEGIRALFSPNSPIDTLFQTAVFPILIASDSKAVANGKSHDATYISSVYTELIKLETKLKASGLRERIRILLIYLPVKSKDDLSVAFDKRLKGIQG